jgi:hypothetical protein
MALLRTISNLEPAMARERGPSRAACSIFAQSLFFRWTRSKPYPPAVARGNFIAGGRPFGLRQNWGFRPFCSTWQVRASTLNGAFRLICSAWAPRDKTHS